MSDAFSDSQAVLYNARAVRTEEQNVLRHKSYMPDFLAEVRVYIDSLELFAFFVRQATFAACSNSRMPTKAAAPLDIGTALPDVLPGKMRFNECFRRQTEA